MIENSWNLNDLAALGTAERRPLNAAEKLELREVRVADAEYRLGRERALLTESQIALAEGWVELKAAQDETEQRDAESRITHTITRCLFVLGLLWFALMTWQMIQRLHPYG